MRSIRQPSGRDGLLAACAAALFLLGLLCIAGAALHVRAACAGETVSMVRVIDGDTIVVDRGGRQEHVRLIGIDTGETSMCQAKRSPSCAWCPAEQAAGLAAKRALAAAVPKGTPVELIPSGRDPYGRLLARIVAPIGGRRADLSDWMLAARLAVPYRGGRKFKPWCAPAPVPKPF